MTMKRKTDPQIKRTRDCKLKSGPFSAQIWDIILRLNR
jgi:hypothetical protein